MRINLNLRQDEAMKLAEVARRLLRDVGNQAHWFVREGLGLNPPRRLDLPDQIGAVTTRKREVVTSVETRLYCNRCQLEMRYFTFWTDGHQYKCPSCGLEERADVFYPMHRPLTAAEQAKLTEG